MVLALFEALGRTPLSKLRLKTTHTLTPDNFVHAGRGGGGETSHHSFYSPTHPETAAY